MKKLNHPLVLVALGLFLGVGVSLATFWQAAVPIVTQARESRVQTTVSHAPEPPWDFWTIEIENLAAELKEAKAALKQREDDVLAREARFASDRLELARQRQQLENLRSEIANTVISIQENELRNMKMLAATYSELSPKAALTIFKQMDDATVVKLLALMNKDVISPLFEELTKQSANDPALARRAAQLTDKLRLYQAGNTSGS